MTDIYSMLKDKTEIKILYSEDDQLSLDEIKMLVGKEAFKIYKGIIKGLENAYINNNPEKIQIYKKRMDIFKSQYGIYKKELLNQTSLINAAFSKGIKVKMPKKYEPYYKQLKIIYCSECKTPYIIREGIIPISCGRCRNVFNYKPDETD